MKEKIVSYLKYAAAGLIASAADNLTYFLLEHFGVSSALAAVLSLHIPLTADAVGLTAARLISLVVNFILLRFAVFQKGKQQNSFFRYILLVIFSTTIVYFLMQLLEKWLPIEPVLIKMGVELLMNFFNYIVTKYLVFEDTGKEQAREEE